MTYVDALTGCLCSSNWQHTRACHLMADTESELIRFGRRIGCKPEWLQHSRTGLAHFDITARVREAAVKAGAKEIDRKAVVELMKKTGWPNKVLTHEAS
jgi:hypothetical protein